VRERAPDAPGDTRRRRGQYFVGTHRLVDVLHLARAGGEVPRRHLQVHLVVHRSRDQHASGPGERLQPRGDVDRVAEHRALLLDDVAEIDADAQLHARGRRQRCVAGLDALLDLECAGDRVHRACELGHQAVADAAEHAAVELADPFLEDVAARLECRKRAGFVGAHQPAVLDDVRRQDGGDLAAVPWHGTPARQSAGV
jgi:hypothetical protein